MKKELIPLILLLLAVVACDPGTKKTEIPDNKPLHVRVHPVEFMEYKIPVRATGMLATSTEMKLSFKTGGIIRKLNIREGESVRRGDVLASLDLSEIQAQVTQARIALEKAGRDLARAENLYRDSVVTLEQFQNAESAFEIASSNKQIADFNLEHSLIRAPSDGKIQKILVETNEIIAPGYPAILFGSLENDWVVRAALTDKDVVKLSLGDSSRVIMDAFPGTSFRAEVIELGSVADPLTATYEVELLILEADRQFRTGFISRAEIFPRATSRSLVVPIETLLDASDNLAFVFLLKEDRAKKRRIRTGAILNDRVVVLEGLSEGDLVISDGVKYVNEDSRVEAVNLKDIR